MKQLWLSLVVLLALAAWGAAPSVSAQGSGKISGIVSGPSGPVAGVRVNVVNNAGVVVGTAVTTPTGGYSVDNLPAGAYTVQVVNSSGVVATGVGTLTAAGPTAVVNLTLTSSQQAAAALAAGGGGMGTTTKVVIAAAAAAAAGIFIWVATKDDTSPTR